MVGVQGRIGLHSKADGRNAACCSVENGVVLVVDGRAVNVFRHRVTSRLELGVTSSE